MKSILVPVDGSLYSLKAIDMALEMAQAFQSKITLVYAKENEAGNYPSNPYTFSPDLAKSISQEKGLLAARILEDGKKRLSCFSGTVETRILSGNPSDEIINYINSNDFDFVIMGSSGMGGLKGALGSVTRRVALAINVPTLIVR